MKACPTCKSPNVDEFVAGWVDANDWEAPLRDMAQAKAYDTVYWCSTCENHPDTLIEIETPPWWDLPDDVAATWASTITEWYAGTDAAYSVAEVQHAWKTLRLVTVETEDDGIQKAYPAVFFYSETTGHWFPGLDTSDRERLRELCDNNRIDANPTTSNDAPVFNTGFLEE
jgi:hypothetical protein